MNILQFLPEEYLEFLKFNSKPGFSLEIINNSNHIIFYPIEDLAKLNLETLANELMPNFFIFGTNGGGTAFAFHKETKKIYAFEFIGMNEDETVLLANDFSDFWDKFNKDEIQIY